LSSVKWAASRLVRVRTQSTHPVGAFGCHFMARQLHAGRNGRVHWQSRGPNAGIQRSVTEYQRARNSPSAHERRTNVRKPWRLHFEHRTVVQLGHCTSDLTIERALIVDLKTGLVELRIVRSHTIERPECGAPSEAPRCRKRRRTSSHVKVLNQDRRSATAQFQSKFHSAPGERDTRSRPAKAGHFPSNEACVRRHIDALARPRFRPVENDCFRWEPFECGLGPNQQASVDEACRA